MITGYGLVEWNGCSGKKSWENKGVMEKHIAMRFSKIFRHKRFFRNVEV